MRFNKATIRRWQLGIDRILYRLITSSPINRYRKQEALSSRNPNHVNRSYVINFGRAGFFSNFFEVLGYAQWCDRKNLIPVVYGGKYCNDSFRRNMYWTDAGYNGSFNVWEYFFEPLSQVPVNFAVMPNNFGQNTLENIFAPDGSGIGLIQPVQASTIIQLENERLEELGQPTLKSINDIEAFAQSKGYSHVWRMLAYQRDYPSIKYRLSVHQLIQKYVRLKPNIRAKIDRFYQSQMSDSAVIGLHVRRTDNIGSEHLSISLDKYCQLVDEQSAIIERATKTVPKIYVATDSNVVLRQLKACYKARVIHSECVRSENERPVHNNYVKRIKDGNPLLGEQVLEDAMLLSRTHFLVHGLSGVASAALFFNPKLNHRNVWNDTAE